MAGKFHYAFCCTIKYPHGSRYEKQIDKPNSGDIMNLFMDPRDAKSYISNSQKARILTEKWTAENIYCIHCKSEHLTKYENNKPVADFYCEYCKQEYELKGKKGAFGNKITAGSYHTMIARINAKTKPDFLGIEYTSDFKIRNFFVIPKHFFVPTIIEKRPPLHSSAQRAGWIGCNILLSSIPMSGRIFLVKEGNEISHSIVRAQVENVNLLKTMNMNKRAWTIDIMFCIEKIGLRHFTLSDIYNFESYLQDRHPNNKHVRDKIRQQIQILRDHGYIEFLGKGHYKLLPSI